MARIYGIKNKSCKTIKESWEFKIMFLFAHIGITLGAAVAVSGALNATRRKADGQKTAQETESRPDNLRKSEKSALAISSWIETLGRFMDIRLLVLGSILPDIIDKPIGIFLFGDGRIFMHSLVVSCLITMAALFLYLKYKRTWLLAIAAGMVSHLILDFMWFSPQIFYWPIDGWNFPVGVRTNYLDIWLATLAHNPAVSVSEGLGLIIIIGMGWYLIRNTKFRSLLIHGRL